MNKEQIERAAMEACIIERNIYNDEYSPYYKKGFKDGAKWRIESVWHTPLEKPEDGEYLTVLQTPGGIKLEIAPWRNGKYQGTHYMEVFLGKATVIKYANINDLLPE